eukprot:7195309-Prymnesium_polylepis.1
MGWRANPHGSVGTHRAGAGVAALRSHRWPRNHANLLRRQHMVHGHPVSHINAESMRPVKSAQEWAALQIEHSQGDYECTSRAWSVISCGLNCQAIHHLFPGVHPCHYAALASLMRPVFEKHGLPTASWNKSYSDSIRYHLSHVHQRMLVE